MNAKLTAKDKCDIKRVISLLGKAAAIADGLELTLGNGAFVDSIIGGVAAELELSLRDE